jgi:hypothetical protein
MKTFFALLLLTCSIAQAQLLPSRIDLFSRHASDTMGKSSSQVYRESISRYDRFVQQDVNSHSMTPYAAIDFEKPRTLSMSNAERTMDAAVRNPVVSLHQYDKYDPFKKGIGFCFGRAMFVHLYLAINGVNRANIKKAFIVGPMSKGSWAWHVTTIVQSKDRSGREIWLAIDPVAHQVMEVKDWYNHWKRQSDDGKLGLYITEATKFGASASVYDERGINVPFYNNYFSDMMDWFENNDVSRQLRL